MKISLVESGAVCCSVAAGSRSQDKSTTGYEMRSNENYSTVDASVFLEGHGNRVEPGLRISHTESRHSSRGTMT